jgi:hypothetical protein
LPWNPLRIALSAVLEHGKRSSKPVLPAASIHSPGYEYRSLRFRRRVFVRCFSGTSLEYGIGGKHASRQGQAVTIGTFAADD